MLSGIDHRGAGVGFATPVMNIGAACLDRERQVQRLCDAGGGGAVGIEELRVDKIERGLAMQFAHQREDRASDGGGIKAPSDRREQREARSVDENAVFRSVMRGFGKGAIPRGKQAPGKRG